MRMGLCIEKFKQEVVTEVMIVLQQVNMLGRTINNRFKYC